MHFFPQKVDDLLVVTVKTQVLTVTANAAAWAPMTIGQRSR